MPDAGTDQFDINLLKISVKSQKTLIFVTQLKDLDELNLILFY